MLPLLSNLDVAIDGTPGVPLVTLLCMATTIIMIVAVPIFAIRHIKKTYHGSLKALIYGMAMYLLFDILVFNIVMIAWTNIKAVGENKLFVAILAAVISGLVAVVGRTIAIHALNRSKNVADGGSFGNAYLSGIGYSLLNIPAMFVAMIMNIIMALMINMFGISYLADDLDEEGIESLISMYETYLTTPSYEFLILGVKIVFLMVISMSLSVIIYSVYKKKAHSLVLLAAAVISILAMLPVYLNQYEVLFKTSLSMILVMALFTAWLAFLAAGIMKTSLKSEINELKEMDVAVAVKKAFPDFNKNIKKEL